MDKKNKKITVAILCTALHQIGGESQHHLNLYKNMDKSKYRVLLVFCSRVQEDMVKFFTDGGAHKEDIFCFPTSKKFLFIPLIINLRKLFKREGVDIVHSFFLHSDVLNFCSSFAAKRRKMISNVEGKFILDEVNGVSKLKQSCYALINAIIRPHFTKTVTVTTALKNELVDQFGVREDKVEVVNIGIDVPSDSDINIDSDGSKSEKIIASAARFTKDKGLEYFIQAVPRVIKDVPQARFVLAGTGEEEDNLKQLATDLGVNDNVTFAGWTKDMVTFMKNMDVFAMTSIREGCPITLMEALSYAKPAVAFDVEGLQEMISNGQDGYLVEPFDVDKFGSAIVDVCKDSKRAAMLGKNGRLKAIKRFSVQIEAEKMASIYEQVNA